MKQNSGLPHNWQEMEELLLLHFVRQGSGASLITQSHVSATAAQFFPQVRCVEIDVEHNPDLLESFRISRIPALLILHKGEVLKSFHGLFSQSKLEDAIQEYLPFQVKN